METGGGGRIMRGPRSARAHLQPRPAVFVTPHSFARCLHTGQLEMAAGGIKVDRMMATR